MMGVSEEKVPYSSLSNLEKGYPNDSCIRYDFSDYKKGVLSSVSRFSRQDSFDELSSDSDFPEQIEPCRDPCIFEQPKANTKVNLKSVFNGMAAILRGGNNVNVSKQQEEATSNISFLNCAPNGDSILHPSVCVASAPYLFETEAIKYSAYREVLQAEPPEWVPDSSSVVCMQCGSPFVAITCRRHHCRFCGGIFCGKCTRGRCLLPVKFRERDPQRVCDSCYDRLDPLQRLLINSISNAIQSAKHDVTDWTCMRGWLNLPLGLSMEHEIYKASCTLRTYCQVARLNAEKSIPWSVLKGASGLAILTVAKAGALVTYKFGTGLVLSRKADGSWSAPSAIASVGLGWGAQLGCELTDFLVVLPGRKALKAFSSHMHFSFGAGLSAAAGPVGRVFEADLRASDRGFGLCYTYSCSKGAFVGISLEGNFVFNRRDTNIRFYGDPYLSIADILRGSVESPKAAGPLYAALDDLYSTLRC